MSTPRFDLVADIGGTNARFALHQRGTRDQFAFQKVYACADFARFEDALTRFRADCGEAFSEAAVAIANPVTGDAVRMTNHHWAFSIAAARQELGLDRLLVLNDFTALALSLPLLARSQLQQLGGGEPVAEASIGVIGPGTGLGVSGLVWAGDHWQPLASEGGHVAFAARNAREWAMSEILRARYGGYLSCERIVSGPGLRALYDAFCALDGVTPEALTPAELADLALQGGDARLAEVFDTFCATLGNAAGNLALTLGARGGIYLGGGIVPRWGEAFLRSSFRANFEAKGRFRDYLSAIPVYVIHAPLPALVGAAAALARAS